MNSPVTEETGPKVPVCVKIVQISRFSPGVPHRLVHYQSTGIEAHSLNSIYLSQHSRRLLYNAGRIPDLTGGTSAYTGFSKDISHDLVRLGQENVPFISI
jgi:hypothetical protein